MNHFKHREMYIEYKFISIYSITNEALLQRFLLMYSFLNPSGNKLVVVKVTILVTLLGHVVILGYNFVETLKVLLTLNISRPP